MDGLRLARTGLAACAAAIKGLGLAPALVQRLVGRRQVEHHHAVHLGDEPRQERLKDSGNVALGEPDPNRSQTLRWGLDNEPAPVRPGHLQVGPVGVRHLGWRGVDVFASLLLMQFTPTKWTHHFGVYAGLAATVAVLPEAEETDVVILEKDLKIDVFRSGGPGGQSVNTTDSAVRITHLPTGIVVSCQNERSQIQNKASAMNVLQAKLLERQRQEDRAKMDALKGDNSGSWGNQMRSYVLHPYQMVKDLRTEYEVGSPSAVLDGDIDGFLEAGIRWRNRRDDD